MNAVIKTDNDYIKIALSGRPWVSRHTMQIISDANRITAESIRLNAYRL